MAKDEPDEEAGTLGDVELPEMKEEEKEAEQDNNEEDVIVFYHDGIEPVRPAATRGGSVAAADEEADAGVAASTPPAGNVPAGTTNERDEANVASGDRRNITTPILSIVIAALASAVLILSLVIILDDDDGDVVSTPVVEPILSPATPEPASPTLTDNRFVEGDGLAQVPKAIVDFIKDIVFLPPAADGRRTLALPDDMLSPLLGNCNSLHQYRPAENSAYWQCGQSVNNPNFYLTNDPSKGIPYRPTEQVLSLMANVTGTSVEALRNMNISSGQPLADLGTWCGMPAAGSDNKESLTGQELLAFNYWLTCVASRSGYFNVLECDGSCPPAETGGNCSTYAVLGYAAMEPGVCYPAHQHFALEAYWQIAGRGWWRTWSNVSALDNFTYASNDNFPGSRYALHIHRSEVPHEYDTTGDLDGDGGDGKLETPMVMIYWWGKQTAATNDYRWSLHVRNKTGTHRYQNSAVSCGDTRRIPVFNGQVGSQTITVANC